MPPTRIGCCNPLVHPEVCNELIFVAQSATDYRSLHTLPIPRCATKGSPSHASGCSTGLHALQSADRSVAQLDGSPTVLLSVCCAILATKHDPSLFSKSCSLGLPRTMRCAPRSCRLRACPRVDAGLRFLGRLFDNPFCLALKPARGQSAGVASKRRN